MEKGRAAWFFSSGSAEKKGIDRQRHLRYGQADFQELDGTQRPAAQAIRGDGSDRTGSQPRTLLVHGEDAPNRHAADGADPTAFTKS